MLYEAKREVRLTNTLKVFSKLKKKSIKPTWKEWKKP